MFLKKNLVNVAMVGLSVQTSKGVQFEADKFVLLAIILIYFYFCLLLFLSTIGCKSSIM